MSFAMDTTDILVGDQKRCPVHGWTLSSSDGLYDAPCGACESEMDIEAEKERFEAEVATLFGFGTWICLGSQYVGLKIEVRFTIDDGNEILF